MGDEPYELAGLRQRLAALEAAAEQGKVTIAVDGKDITLEEIGSIRREIEYLAKVITELKQEAGRPP